MDYRREIALVYSVEEAITKLNIIRGHGFSEHEIHMFSKDIHPFQSLKMYTDIQVHLAGNWFDQLISMFTRKNMYEISLHSLHLTPEESDHYGHGIELGAIFLFAEHKHPYEKETKKQQAAFNLSRAVD